jgi:hypothetical protein
MTWEFTGDVFYWRGPAPFYFVTVPEDESDQLRAEWSFVSYGWGMIPVTARIGATEWTTSLFPKDGSYVLPLKLAVRQAQQIEDAQPVTVRLTVAA